MNVNDCFRLHKWMSVAFGFAGCVGLCLVLDSHLKTTGVQASDHIDSPSIAQDRGADIADLWAFLDPNDNSKVVLVMSTQGFIVSSEHFGMAIFDPYLRYRFEIENTGDAVADTYVDVQYSPGVGRETPQTATITLPNGHSFQAQTTIATQDYQSPAPVITVDPASGAAFFGGVADDPFFLDDTGANRYVASVMAGTPNPALLYQRGGRDTYAGFNSMLTVVSVPANMLKGNSNVIGVNALTQRQSSEVVSAGGSVIASGPWVTIDRSGNPLVNNGLIPPALKNSYNATTTAEDAAGKFRDTEIKTLQMAGTNPTYINKILNTIQVNGDILRLDLTVPNVGPGGGNNLNGGYGKMGGRRLQDDVVDITFTLINNGGWLGDLVNANQVPFRNEFPFVHDPIQPFTAGTIDDETRQ